ncbi:MAG: glycosyltransferase family 2 protein [Treponema sp.]|nr:glycosyltransferase family 2 protein [Treponema sp.]
MAEICALTNFLVSIIIPVYKVEPYLHQCVDSVLSQTYKNIEIILVDDGSPDTCPKICDEYAVKDSRVRVIHKENGGLSDARNAGIKIATGEWLSFVDSDDVVHPQMIELLIKPLVDEPLMKISAGGYKNFFTNNIEYSPVINERLRYEKLSLYEYFYKPLYVVAWGKIYHKSLFENIEYPKGRFHEDEFVTYKILWLAKEISFLDEPLYMYRQRKDSIMANVSEKRLSDTLDALTERIDFFVKKNDIKASRISQKVLLSFYAQLFSYPQNQLKTHEIKSKCKSVLKTHVNDGTGIFNIPLFYAGMLLRFPKSFIKGLLFSIKAKKMHRMLLRGIIEGQK